MRPYRIDPRRAPRGRPHLRLVGGTDTSAAPDEFAAIDGQIEDLRARLDTYRKATLLSRAAILASLVILVLLFVSGRLGETPVAVFAAFTGALGGLIWLGATRTSAEEATGLLAEAEARKARLIDEVAARNGWIDLTPTVH